MIKELKFKKEKKAKMYFGYVCFTIYSLKIQSAHGIFNLQRSKRTAEGWQAEEACDFLEKHFAFKLKLFYYFQLSAFSTKAISTQPRGCCITSTLPRPATL